MNQPEKPKKKKVSQYKILEIQEKFKAQKLPGTWWLEVYHRKSGDYLQVRWGFDQPQLGRSRKVLYLGEIHAAMMALCAFYLHLPSNVRSQLNLLSTQYAETE